MLNIHRYKRSHFLWSNYLSSKLNTVELTDNICLKLDKLSFMAGLYKPNSLMYEHSLILGNISGHIPEASFQFHGKRQRKTVILTTLLTNFKIWPIIDKLTHELIPSMQD